MTSPLETPAFPDGAAAIRELRVLCVEDDADSAALVQALVNLILTRNGYTPHFVVAGDGESALRMARESTPDLVLLDLGLPDISGEEVMWSLREDEATAGVPVIVLTAQTHPSRPLPDDYAAYVTKPIDNVQGFMDIVERSIA
jgi:CheY-like chemotaxis protein